MGYCRPLVENASHFFFIYLSTEHMLKLMGKKIFTILRSKLSLSIPISL